jgi:hypothetical protein
MAQTAMSPAHQAAIEYARRGWPVLPVSARKVPLTEHGLLDAITTEAQIREWWTRWPDAVPSIATGKPSGVIALDVDVRPGVHGPDSLEAIGCNFHPVTLTAHTPSGGYHCLFQWPGHEVRNSTGKLGPGLDIRGDGGSLMLPPGPGRYWDPHLGLDRPLAPMPVWVVIKEPEQPRLPAREPFRPVGKLSPYCEAAARNAFKRIIEAPYEQQETTLNSEAFGLARLVGDRGMPPGLALDVLHKAAQMMPSYNRHRPWRQKELDRKVTDAFAAGLRSPLEARHG